MMTQNQTDCTLEDLASSLDSLHINGIRWDVWRTSEKLWLVKIAKGEQSKTFNEFRLFDALKKAVEWKFLPAIPRLPRVYLRSGFAIYKQGRSWCCRYVDFDFVGELKTRKEAEALADSISERSAKAMDNWIEKFGWARDKTEGVDFIWE